jgi:hypothetical protein
VEHIVPHPLNHNKAVAAQKLVKRIPDWDVADEALQTLSDKLPKILTGSQFSRS